jgi:hypothetical protein
LNIGWLASVHDECILRNCALVQQSELFFSSSEYLLGDSVFSNQTYLVPGFIRLGCQEDLAKEQSRLNKFIPLQHLMKCSFLYMKATATLHKFFVQHNPPSSWMEEEDRDEQFLNELHHIFGL